MKIRGKNYTIDLELFAKNEFYILLCFVCKKSYNSNCDLINAASKIEFNCNFKNKNDRLQRRVNSNMH